MKKFACAGSSRKWGDDGSEDRAEQPPPAVFHHPSDDDRSEALSPDELERRHTEMILALTRDGASTVYSGSAAAPPLPAEDGVLHDQHLPLGDDIMQTSGDLYYDERLAHKLHQDKYPAAPSSSNNNASCEDLTTKKHRDYYGDDDLATLDPIEHAAEILELTGGGAYSPVARKKSMESKSSNSRGSSSRVGAERGSYKFSATTGAARASAPDSESSYPQPPMALTSMVTSSAAVAFRRMRLLRPSQSRSFSKNALSSVDRTESGLSTPGAYVVEGTNASGGNNGGGQSVIHEGGDGEEDMRVAVQERASDPLATGSSTYAVGQAWTSLFQDEEPPRRALLEAQVEQVGVTSQYNSGKYPARRRCFVVTGVLLVVVVAVVVAAVIVSGGGDKNYASDEVTAPLADKTDTPSTAPTAFVCSVQDIYLECQGSSSRFQSNSIPDCASQFYQTYREFLSPQIDPTIQDLEPTSCAPQNLALYTLASTEETESIRTKYILNVLYFSTNGHLWKDNTNWLSIAPECSWFGVNCADDGLIRELALVDNDLFGTLPPVIGLLGTLLKLNLGRNNLMSPIPPELSNLQDLYLLDLNRASLDPGPIPAPILNLSRLEFLDLSSTGRTGTIPEELNTLTLLSSLLLENNAFVGILPSDLFFLPFLTVLIVGSNGLTGTIPNEIGNATLMIRLNLERNYLGGTMPTSIGLLTSLALFTFSNNYLSGLIPQEVCGLWNHSLTTFGGPIAECQGRAIFYGNLECPSRECCQNCKSIFPE